MLSRGSLLKRCRILLLATQGLMLCVASAVRADLQADVAALTQAPALRYATVGLLITDAETGRELCARNADLRLMPASNLKLLTGAAAYELLGPGFRFTTKLLACGKLTGGALSGSLVLRGTGDPSLTHQDLDRLAARLHAAGVRRISGGIVADASAFADSGPGTGWSWDYLEDYYAAEVSALTVDGGCVTAIARGADRPGARPSFRLEPSSDALALAAEVTTSPTSASPVLYRKLGSSSVGLRGALGVGERVQAQLTVRDPARYCGLLLRGALKRQGIAVVGGVTPGVAPRGARELARVDSAPLLELLGALNKHSDNVTAEALLRAISHQAGGVGSREASVRRVDDWVSSFGADPRAFTMVDGSGLSRLNATTPRLLVQLLCHMSGKAPWLGTLPVMGRDGTLAGRLAGTEVEGKVRGKTGFISGVRALSGYAQTASGRTLAFSILVNGTLDTIAAGEFQNQVCRLMVAL